jgi:hypothetical protein
MYHTTTCRSQVIYVFWGSSSIYLNVILKIFNLWIFKIIVFDKLIYKSLISWIKEKWILDTSAHVWDISVPRQISTSIRQISTSKRQIGTFLIMSVLEKIPIMQTILLHCIQLSSDIVKLKEVFLPHPFYHVSWLLLKIFSIWLAHALGSDMDSKNNKIPYTVIFFSLYVQRSNNHQCKHKL